jgi:hypothetical protein
MKSRNYTFTVNNYTEEHLHVLKEHDCRAMGIGKEVGKEGTPHLQGWVVYPNQRSESGVRKAWKRMLRGLGGAHLEIMRSKLDVNREYCKKEGKYEERGDIPMSQKDKGEKNKERWDLALALSKEGRFEEIPVDIYFRYRSTCHKIYEDHKPAPVTLDTLDNHWFYGASGTGKSKEARDKYPSAYIKMNNKWWDGYKGEEHVIIDDFDKYDVAMSGHLKRWCDHYPFPAEFKGGTQLIRPKVIIVTSNYTPEEIWEDENTLGPINRRFKKTRFTNIFKA